MHDSSNINGIGAEIVTVMFCFVSKPIIINAEYYRRHVCSSSRDLSA
jgi:predicted cobalt transporter CbtA